MNPMKCRIDRVIVRYDAPPVFRIYDDTTGKYLCECSAQGVAKMIKAALEATEVK